MNEKMQEYREKFNEQFPLMMVMGMADDEIIKIIDSCIESGEPYEPEIEEGALY